MRLYLAVARASVRRHVTYRAAAFAGAFANIVFGLIRAYVLIALFQTKPEIGGYDVAAAVTFCFLTQGLIGPIAVFSGGLPEVAQRFRSGDIALDLYRPADFQGWLLATDLGRAVPDFCYRSIPPLLAGALVFELRLPDSPALWLAVPVTAVLAVVVSFALRYLVMLAATLLHDERGVSSVATILALFFSGIMIPLTLFPAWLRPIAELSPWAATIQVPADIFLGRYHGFALVAVLAGQVIWALALLGLGRVLTARVRRRVVVQGG
ncbi:MAG TPA: ABC-2 family transporter protein [Actinomycetes bacterium]|nr:ABC-2 family transporter protein [Actinomycetes bacterium]